MSCELIRTRPRDCEPGRRGSLYVYLIAADPTAVVAIFHEPGPSRQEIPIVSDLNSRAAGVSTVFRLVRVSSLIFKLSLTLTFSWLVGLNRCDPPCLDTYQGVCSLAGPLCKPWLNDRHGTSMGLVLF